MRARAVAGVVALIVALATRASAGPAAAAPDTDATGLQLPHPTASYRTFLAASGALRGIVSRVLGPCADSVRWQREYLPFRYRDKLSLLQDIKGRFFWAIDARPADARVYGLRASFSTARADCPGDDALRRGLEAAGWAEDFQYSADGPDGTTFAYVCHEALGFVEMSWVGGDESDSTFVPPPGYTLKLTCVPRPPTDPMLLHLAR